MIKSIKKILADRWARYCLIALGLWLLMPISLLIHSYNQEQEYKALVNGFCSARLARKGSLIENIEFDGYYCWDKTNK